MCVCVSHIGLVVVGGGGGPGGDERLPGALEADWELPQHGGVSHWGQLVVS